jgi:hypothetical protein
LAIEITSSPPCGIGGEASAGAGEGWVVVVILRAI